MRSETARAKPGAATAASDLITAVRLSKVEKAASTGADLQSNCGAMGVPGVGERGHWGSELRVFPAGIIPPGIGCPP